MKKISIVILTLLSLIFILVSCKGNSGNSSSSISNSVSVSSSDVQPSSENSSDGSDSDHSSFTSSASSTTNSSEDSSSSSETSSSSSKVPLSDKKELTIKSICGQEVVANKVTLNKTQLQTLKSDGMNQVVYSVSEKATCSLAVNDTTLVFTVIAEDSSSVDYQITVTLLSDLSDVNIVSVFGNEVIKGKVTLSESQYKNLVTTTDLKEIVTVTNSEKSTYTLTYSQSDRILKAICTAEDKISNSTSQVQISVNNIFGHSEFSDIGSSDNGFFSYTDNAYKLNGTAVILNENGKPLTDYYSINVKLVMNNMSENSELVFSSYQEQNLTGRFVLRAVSDSQALLFTDYKDTTNSFVHYTELKTGISINNGEQLEFTFINNGNSMVMIYGGQTLYRLTLNNMAHSELLVYTTDCEALLFNTQINADENQVKNEYNLALTNYSDTLIGKSILNTSENLNEFVQQDNGLYVNGASSNKRVMGGLYYEGKAVGGFEWATSGHVSASGTKTSGGYASKIEFQIAMNLNKFVKWHIFRYPSNNTIHRYVTDSSIGKTGKDEALVDAENNKYIFPGTTTTTWDFDYIFIFNNGIYEFWLKDANTLTEWTMIDSLDTGWGYSIFCMAMRQYVNVTFSDIKAYYNEDFDTVYNQLHPANDLKLSSSSVEFNESGDVIAKANQNYADFSDKQKLFLANGENAIIRGNFAVSGTLSFTVYNDWKQAEIGIYQDERNALRFVLEYAGNGYYQVFTEYMQNDLNWSNWKAVILPNSLSTANMCFTLISKDGIYYLLINGYKYYVYDNLTFTNPFMYFSGNTGVKISNLSCVTDENKLASLIENMVDYTYVSGYKTRIDNLANEYANAEKGGILLAGSSTIDYWDTWQEDLGADVNAYNVGIGGTTTLDWIYAYDKLISPFAPSKLVLFLGGNDVNNLGSGGVETADRLMQILEKVHADFPSCEIYYVLSLPCPNNYKNGEYTTEYGILIQTMKTYASQNDFFTAIDMESQLTSNGNAIADYFKADNVHMTTKGYEVWTSIIRKYLFKENV